MKRKDEIIHKKTVNCVSSCLDQLGLFSQMHKRKYLENMNEDLIAHCLIFIVSQVTHLPWKQVGYEVDRQ